MIKLALTMNILIQLKENLIDESIIFLSNLQSIIYKALRYVYFIFTWIVFIVNANGWSTFVISNNCNTYV